MTKPTVWQDFRDTWDDPSARERLFAAYAEGRTSFLADALPGDVLGLPPLDVLALLRRRHGSAIDEAVSAEHTTASPAAPLPPAPLRGPVADLPDGRWLASANMVGINVRTVGSFWNVVAYALTLPACQDAVHLLPIWEPGVVGSLYGMASWNVNDEFFSTPLRDALPHLDTVDRQLAAVVNVLHVMGRAVGMDVVPHTDRFSEQAFAVPEHFEWLQREDLAIVDHRSDLHVDVQRRIGDFLVAEGSGCDDGAVPARPEDLFLPDVDEATRLRVLFGPPTHRRRRTRRRVALVRHLARYGLEPVPATMAPPYRGIEVDPRPEARRVDAHGLVWRDYRMTAPQPMSRVFGPLARYKLYERLDDNAAWAVDFSRPRQPVWDYVCRHYGEVRQRFRFDFMRGDMSHVQMRPEGPPAAPDDHYDILGAVKRHIRSLPGAASFAYFAESFLAPRGTMTYGDEADHLSASGADAALGDLQSTVVGSAPYLQRLRRYADLTASRPFAAACTLFTADKDDPRFDEFYRTGSAVRLFTALGLGDQPSYMGLGFEIRDVHVDRAPNEHYTKLYVFEQQDGPNATGGPWVWGRNGSLYALLGRIRSLFDDLGPDLRGRPTRWLLAPDATGHCPLMAWTQADQASFVFVVNTSATTAVDAVHLPHPMGLGRLEPLFSTERRTSEATSGSIGVFLGTLAPSECRAYRVVPA